MLEAPDGDVPTDVPAQNDHAPPRDVTIFIDGRELTPMSEYDPHHGRRGDHAVYVLECADGSLYTGYTTDIDRRLAEHNAGEGAKYTRGRTPVSLVHREYYDSRSRAMSREYEIKQLTRAKKVELIELE